jgi:predicted N-formylglutamate amidohydrolase
LKEFESLGYVAMINQPYDGKQGGNHSQNNAIGFDLNAGRQAMLFEFRNDILQCPVRGPKLRTDFVGILNKLLKPQVVPDLAVLCPGLVEPQKVKDSFVAPNAVVLSYNDDKKVRIAFLAEHAGQELPPGYHWSSEDLANVVSKGLHYDPNTLQLANFLAHKFETSLIFTRLSKLLVDPNCQLTSKDIFPQTIAGIKVKLNENISIEEETLRYERYFLGLVKGILYLHQKISSHYWFSIQSFAAELLPEADIIISYYANDQFAKKFSDRLIKSGYKVSLNHPLFDGKQLFGYTNTTFLNGFYPRKRESLILLFSTRILQADLSKVKADMSELIKDCCLHSSKE